VINLVACVCGLAVLSSSAVAQQPLDVQWVTGRLTVRASNVPLVEVVDQVARATGMDVIGREKLTGRVSVEFANLPLVPALARLLVDVNYLVQERQTSPAGTTASSSSLVLRIHSMDAAYTLPADALTGPIPVRALDQLVAAEAADVAETREQEAEDDPDVLEERREDQLEASALVAQGAFGPNAHIESLIALMDSYNDEIRLEALKAIGTRPMPAALETLTTALGDEAWEVRNAAVEILGRAGDADSIRAVGDVLETSDDRDARIDALRVLALRGGAGSEPHLRAVLTDSDALIRDVAAQLLAEIDRRALAKESTGRP
jgi:hypothetical protein